MKKLLKQIDTLCENIESGLLTKSEAMKQIRELRLSISDKYNEGSDNFMILIYSLIDANNLIEDLY